ncbi:MAG: hypothetical protein IPH44_36960 [Myxococcales bacterium]|jgi:hypothetical protein|nr:hypothetical protein [Myxococcales bacterium]MBP6848065.1 hypothetical protein [Kofleriaceae bacterium]
MLFAGAPLIHKAAARGAATRLCVRPARFTPTAGALAGRVVTIAGTVAGADCGPLDLTPR